MSYLVKLTTSQCFYDQWIPVYGLYWACDSIEWRNDRAWINMSTTGGTCPGGERHRIKYRESAVFSNGFKVEVTALTEYNVTIRISEAPKEPDMTKAQIISVRLEGKGYNVGGTFNLGDTIKSECTVKNIGGGGTVYLTAGLGYLDSSNMIFLTGFPVSDQLYLNYQQFYTFKEDIKVDITDYYRQQGIGWAYLQQQMYLFFLVGHKTNGDLIWDTEKHIKIDINEPEEFKDPTDIDETIIEDIIDVVDDGSGAFGGLGGLKWLYDTKKDAEHIPDWIANQFRDEDEDDEEPRDMMPFIYIGFAGLIGYLLIRSQ